MPQTIHVLEVTHLDQTVIEIINAKFKLEQLETRTQLIN